MLTRSLPGSITYLLDRSAAASPPPLHHLLRAGLRVLGPARPAHRLWHAHRPRLQRTWHHSRAHRFFAPARWSADQRGLILLDLILVVQVPDAAPVRLVADDPRALAPCSQTKAAPSVADMPATLRRVLLATHYRHGQVTTPTLPEILQVQAAWAAAGT